MFRISSNFDEIRKRLEKLQKQARALDGEHHVSVGELFDSPFMLKYTQFLSIGEMFEAGGFHIASQEDLETVPEEQLDRHVRAHTQFATWAEMKAAAGREWVKRKLGF